MNGKKLKVIGQTLKYCEICGKSEIYYIVEGGKNEILKIMKCVDKEVGTVCEICFECYMNNRKEQYV